MEQQAPLTLDIFPVETEILQPSAFLKLVRENPSLIKSSTPVPPRPGRNEFGAFRVVYKHPIYKQAA